MPFELYRIRHFITYDHDKSMNLQKKLQLLRIVVFLFTLFKELKVRNSDVKIK